MTRAQYLKYKKRKRRQRRITAALLAVAIVLLAVCGLVLAGVIGPKRGNNGGGGTKTVTPKPTDKIAEATPTSTPSPTPSPSPTPTPTPMPNFVSMVAVGDNLYDWYLLEDGYDREDGTFDFSHNYDYIKPYIQMADFAVVNQETPLGGDEGYIGDSWEEKYFGNRTMWGSYHGYASFNTPDEVGHELVKAGFNIITMATNHTSDHGYKAVRKSIEFWRNNYPDVTLLGIHDSVEDQNKITVVEKYGIKIALLNYTYGLNKKSATDEAAYCVDILKEDRVRSDIARAKEMADFVVVFPHWGEEYAMDTLNSTQKKFTKIFLECGVDAVVGAHPHIGQTMEWLTGADGHKMVVYYSLGNFISNFKEADCNVEGMAYLEFYKDGDECYVREGSMIPIINHWEYSNEKLGNQGKTKQGKNYRVYALQDYTEELARGHGCIKYSNGKSFSYSRIYKVAEKLWGDYIKIVDWSGEEETGHED